MFLTSLKQFCIREFFCSFVCLFFLYCSCYITFVLSICSHYESPLENNSQSIVTMPCVFFSHVTACMSLLTLTEYTRMQTQQPFKMSIRLYRCKFLSLLSHTRSTQRSILQTVQTQDEKGEYIREDEENTDCYFTN